MARQRVQRALFHLTGAGRFSSCLLMLVLFLGLSGCTGFMDQERADGVNSDQAERPIDTGQQTAETMRIRLPEKPIMQLAEIKGTSLTEEQFISVGGKRDRIQVLNVWASWCQPCIDEAPDLRRFAADLPDGVELIGINASKYDDRDEVMDFVDRYQLQFPQIWDAEGVLTDQLRAISYPTTAVVNRNGEVVWLHTGPVTAEGLRQIIRLLN